MRNTYAGFVEGQEMGSGKINIRERGHKSVNETVLCSDIDNAGSTVVWASRHWASRHSEYGGHKQTPWPLVRKRNIPTERPPLVGEIWCQLLRI
jgi:hypothetical protein